MSSSIDLVHISDLHLVEDLYTTGGTFKSRSKGAKSHSRGIIAALSSTLGSFRERDSLLIVSGDVTTDGASGSLRSAKAYLDQTQYSTPDRQYPIPCLGWPQDRRIVVPGNHDRYDGRWFPRQVESVAFEAALELPSYYPFVRVHVPPDDPTFAVAFFVLNSVPSGDIQERYPRHKRPGVIAGGYVPDAMRSQLVLQSEGLSDTGRAIDLGGQEVNISGRTLVKVAIVHHHPVPNPNTDTRAWRHPVRTLKNAVFAETIAEGEALLKALWFAGVQLVLFGHKHQAFQSYIDVHPNDFYADRNVDMPDWNRMWFACCPSTSQYDQAKPGFYAIEVGKTCARLRQFSLQSRDDPVFTLDEASAVQLDYHI
ncbi:MAG: metallophosphoesterase [Actinomycetota bacterium]